MQHSKNRYFISYFTFLLVITLFCTSCGAVGDIPKASDFHEPSKNQILGEGTAVRITQDENLLKIKIPNTDIQITDEEQFLVTTLSQFLMKINEQDSDNSKYPIYLNLEIPDKLVEPVANLFQEKINEKNMEKDDNQQNVYIYNDLLQLKSSNYILINGKIETVESFSFNISLEKTSTQNRNPQKLNCFIKSTDNGVTWYYKLY